MLVGRIQRLLTAAAVAVGSVAYLGLHAGDAETAASAATPPTLVIPVNAASRGYLPPTMTIHRGQTLRIVNRDGVRHTVTSVGLTRSGQRLFAATLFGYRTVLLTATSHLAPGRYAFYCNFHARMRGTLVVLGTGGGTTGATQTFNQPLVVPAEWGAKSSQLSFAIKKAYVRVFATGPKTLMWTYGGTYPGPTIRRRTGQRTTVSFVDRLPYKFSVHLHGDHHASADDGQPNSYLLTPGASHTYTYPLTDDGKPERGGFFYYHDHRLGMTARDNWMGMQGMFIVDDPTREAQLHLPGPAESNNGTHPFDIPLIVADRSFTSTNQLTDPFPSTSMMTMGATAPPNDATIGNRILVNGRYSPYFDVATHRYRFRLLNSSTFQSYDFKLSNGQAFSQIGSGDSLLPHTVRRTDILLGPAQRADVVVDFRANYGKRINLVSVPRATPRNGGVPTPAATLMQFRVTRRLATDTSTVPATLLPAPPLAPVTDHRVQTWAIGPAVKTAHGSYWAFNGYPYNPARAYQVTLGDTAQWVLVNHSAVTHYVHLHEEQWQTINRDGKAPPPWELGLQDTWKLDPGEWVKVQGTFSDYTGVFMIHCHMLDHEDHGLMAQFQVKKPAVASSAAVPSAAIAPSPRSTQGPDKPPHRR